jgi:putative FmdB family regulatory protein
MPIYEYRCEQGHTFEVLQRITEDPLATCQTCEAPVERVYHPVAVHFKGSGFYTTDYGTRKRQAEGKDGDGGSSESSEKKPEPGKADSQTSKKSEKADSSKAAA